jgi:hypothetical protein
LIAILPLMILDQHIFQSLKLQHPLFFIVFEAELDALFGESWHSELIYVLDEKVPRVDGHQCANLQRLLGQLLPCNLPIFKYHAKAIL